MPDGLILAVLEFFAVGVCLTAVIFFVAKGGGMMPQPQWGGMRLSPHRLKTADARQGVGASHLTTYFERVYLINCPMVQADAGGFVFVAIFSCPAVEAVEAA